ncbi:YcxB-like protein [Fontibacillus phaseoli]|uniref:YcxB-like protein n=1 Tax=Fontibacillus phaseoli TaxID=1416533 RepID=A0A369BL20_9BACL|nr:YcxB family protein [Fontibacillus phaseoli]RCX20394.1 YcxB-like protein [Fontibacillus phaseoli]
MEIYFELKFDDLMGLQKDAINHSKHHKKVKFWYFIFVLILFSAYLKFFNFSTVTVTITVIFLILYPWIYRYVTILSLKRILKEQNHFTTLGLQKIIISDEGIVRETENSKSNFNWNHFVKLRKDDKNYFLYISDLQAVIISKQGLKDKESEQKLKEYLRKYIDPNI